MIFNFINLYVFLVSFAIGLFFVYIYGPDMKTIYIYPSPENVDKIIFKDKADNCFGFEPVEVECPKDKSLINEIPPQN
jgi:hypothetical protein